MKKLKDMAKLEGYADISEEEFKALENKLSPDTDKDLELFKKDIVKMLSTEIVKRYYYQRGEIIELLKGNEGTEKALEILNDPVQYKEILFPVKKS